MTHIWQYVNWDERQIHKLYPTPLLRDVVYEGMATWASIQMLYSLGETTYASQQEALMAAREDVYGVGFRFYRERYDLIRDEGDVIISPFTTFPPL